MGRSLLLGFWLIGFAAGFLPEAAALRDARAREPEDDVRRLMANPNWEPRYTVNVLQRCEPPTKDELEKLLAAEESSIRRNEKKNLCGANLRWKKLEHRSWRGAKLTGAQMTGANLAGADLRDADLVNTALGGVDFTRTNLAGADFRGAVFYHPHPGRAKFEATLLGKADLSGANLQSFDLSNLELGEAKLSQSWLAGADLRNSNLAGANLDGAVLYAARLDGADLSSSNLANADLRSVSMAGANISGARFEPKSVDGQSVLGVKGLSEVRFDDPSHLVELKQALREIGLRSEERAVISALRKYQLRRAPLFEQWFDRYVLGGALTDFGARPSRPVVVLLLGILGFAAVYLWAFRFPRPTAGVWKIWPDGRLEAGRLRAVEPELVRAGSLSRAAKLALHFSLLSAFRIGWRELNVGSWIARIQPQEYVFRAAGWTRTVAGLQSVLSVYLLALWALSYFGRPFE